MRNILNIEIQPYSKAFEKGWVRCKALSYLHSQFHDQMSQTKDQYSLEEDGYDEMIELVALHNDQVVGLVDVGIYSKERSQYDSYVPHADKGSYMDAIAVHPDYQRQGIAQLLWDEAVSILKHKKIDYLTIFTRDDKAPNTFYKKNGAQLLTKHFRVKGIPKKEPYARGYFKVDLENQSIGEFDALGDPLLCSPDYPHTFFVYDEKGLEQFEIESVNAEYSYVLYL